MSTVSDYLTNLIQKHLDEHGIVIWYDPKVSYCAYIEKKQIDCPILVFQGSYFELRHQLEPYLEWKARKKVLVYVPEDHNEAASPLIEAEYCGTILKPGGPTGKNTRLEIIVRNALDGIFDNDTIVNFEKSIQQEILTLEDLDTLTESRQETRKAGSLSLIFPNAGPIDILLTFLSDSDYDGKIDDKNAFEEFRTFVSVHTGFESKIEKISEYRNELSRYILISDFLAKVIDIKKISKLDKVPQTHKRSHTEFCKNCVKEWQCRRDLQESYIQAAEITETKLGILSIEVPVEVNYAIDTFPYYEKVASDYCINLIDKYDYKLAQKTIDARKQLFWADVNYQNTRLLWNILAQINELNRHANYIKSELKRIGNCTPVQFIEKYTIFPNPNAWYRLDLLQRHFERAYSDYDEPQSGENSLLRCLIFKTRNNYSETANLIAESYSEILQKNNFSYKGMLSQREIFSKIVSPHLAKGKTVYFLIDAFRYEMGIDLYDSLEFEYKTIQPAVATPPTITPVGMAALLPEADTSFGIQIGGSPSIGIKINDTILKTRDDRIQYFQNIISQKTIFLKLDETLKISKTTEKKIKNADLIVITTQEIDDFSTYKDNKELVRHIMSIVLGQLKRAINNLSQLEIQNFILTADHGHIFGENIGSENKIPGPGGDTLYLDRRSWIGKGGEADPSYMRMKPEVFEIQAESDFAFPKNIACFIAKGDLVFFHGGLSLQESIIPVIEVVGSTQKVKSPEKGLHFELTYPKEKITNRFFSIELSFDWRGIIVGPEQYTVRIEFEVEKKEGKVVSASYGFNENTSEITVKRNDPCYITLMVPEGISQSKTTIYLIDADTSKELSKIEDLKISLSM